MGQGCKYLAITKFAALGTNMQMMARLPATSMVPAHNRCSTAIMLTTATYLDAKRTVIPPERKAAIVCGNDLMLKPCAVRLGDGCWQW